MGNDIESFKSRLRQALEIRNMKQIELAEKTGLTRGAISQYLSGYTMPKTDRIYRLAKALNVSETWLMGFDVPMDKKEEVSKADKIFEMYNDDNNKRLYAYAKKISELSMTDRKLVENLIDTLSKKGEN